MIFNNFSAESLCIIKLNIFNILQIFKIYCKNVNGETVHFCGVIELF